jgi:predicted transcriptional regulator
MSTVKEKAMEALSTLPDEATMDDIMYRLYVLDKVNHGLRDVEEGNTITDEELDAEIEKW